MRFYQLEYHLKGRPLFVGDRLSRREWFGAERGAVVRRLDLFKTGMLRGKKADHPVEAVDVPTVKADLLVWLNRECV